MIRAISCFDPSNRNLAVGASRNYFDNVKRFYRDSNGDYLLQAIEEDFLVAPVNMYFRKVAGNQFFTRKPVSLTNVCYGFAFQGSSYRTRFDPIIWRVIESGLVQRWSDISRSEFDARKLFIDEDMVSEEAATLTIDQYAGIFIALASGLAVSSIVFVGEIIVSKYQTSRQSKVPQRRRRIAAPAMQSQRRRAEQPNVCYVQFDRHTKRSTVIIKDW